MVSTEFKGVGLHDTAFRDAIREDSRQTTPSRGVTPRKKFAVKANVESRVNMKDAQEGEGSEGVEIELNDDLKKETKTKKRIPPGTPRYHRLTSLQPPSRAGLPSA